VLDYLHNEESGYTAVFDLQLEGAYWRIKSVEYTPAECTPN
jgi:hypothetical protein